MYKWLNRRSQKRSYTWQGFWDLVKQDPLSPVPEFGNLKRLGWSFGYVKS